MMEGYGIDMVSIRLNRDTRLLSDKPIDSPESALLLLSELIHELDRECVCVINLQGDGKPINMSVCSIGAINQTLAVPRDLVKSTILSNACSLIMVHNHVSGNLEPSKADFDITYKMHKLCAIIGVEFLDHVIVGKDTRYFYSFREQDKLDFKDSKIYNNEKREDEMIEDFKAELKQLYDTDKTGYQSVGEAMDKMSNDALISYFKSNITGGEMILINYIREQITADEINKIKYKEKTNDRSR